MEDARIVALYFDRDETAISESQKKYDRYLTAISYNILADTGETEECVSDTYLAAWNAMPPHRPQLLSAFLGKITRRLSIDRYRARSAAKRGGGETALALEELGECIGGQNSTEDALAQRELAALINRFLGSLGETERLVFLRRYWYLEPIAHIAAQLGFSKSKVTSMLRRTREKLRAALEKEGY